MTPNTFSLILKALFHIDLNELSFVSNYKVLDT